MKYALFLCSLLIPLTTFADSCDFEVQKFERIQLQRMRYGPQKECVILLSPYPRPLQWRSYAYFESGLFMIFLNFGNGPQHTDTAARTYYFFPRIQEPTYKISSHKLVIQDASGLKHTYNTQSGQPIKIEKTRFLAQENVSHKNEGGFKITDSKSLYLENGFKYGELPYVDEQMTSILRKGSKQCYYKNADLFQYNYKKQPDGSMALLSIELKLNDKEVQELITHCAN